MVDMSGSRGKALVMLFLIGLALLFTWRLAQHNTGQNTLLANQTVIGDKLRQTSDDLTRMARLHAVTGDARYREYFDEILAIRNGELPRPEQYFTLPYWDVVLAGGERPTGPGETKELRALFTEAGLSDAELALLAESEDQSNALTILEYEVMDTVVAQVEAGTGVYALEGEALEAMLRLHGDEYHAAKERVMRPLVSLLESLRQGLSDSVDQQLKEASQTLTAIFVWIILAIAGAVLIFLGNRGRPRIALPAALQVILLALALYSASGVLTAMDFGQRVSAGGLDVFVQGDILRQTSDDLTRMARLNAVTGEARYREYFDEILAIRNGDAPRPEQYHEIPWWDIVLATGERPTAPGETKALRALFTEIGLGDAELALLAEAEDQSNALTKLEYEVLDAVAAELEDAGGVYTLEGEALDNMLRLYGEEYHSAKERVMRPLFALLDALRQGMLTEGEEMRDAAVQTFTLLPVTLGLAFLIGIWSFLRQRSQTHA